MSTDLVSRLQTWLSQESICSCGPLMREAAERLAWLETYVKACDNEIKRAYARTAPDVSACICGQGNKPAKVHFSGCPVSPLYDPQETQGEIVVAETASFWKKGPGGEWACHLACWNRELTAAELEQLLTQIPTEVARESLVYYSPNLHTTPPSEP